MGYFLLLRVVDDLEIVWLRIDKNLGVNLFIPSLIFSLKF